MSLTFERLGKYIHEVDVRNANLSVTKLMGVNLSKQMMPSVANIVGTDLSTYKVVQKRQFACKLMSVGRDACLPIALKTDDEPVIISSAYYAFEVNDENELMPEYLMICFLRPDFDRELWFRTGGDVRGGVSWDTFCDMLIPLVSIDEQRKIAQEYQSINNRIVLFKEIIDCLEQFLSLVFRKLFFDNGNIEYSKQKLCEIAEIIDNRGKTPPYTSNETSYPLIEIASLRTAGRIIALENCSKFIDQRTYENWFRSGHPKPKDILMSTVGSLAELKLYWGTKGSIAQNIVAFRCKNEKIAMYLYQYMIFKRQELVAYEIGSVQASIKVSQVINYEIAIPPESIIEEFDSIATKMTNYMYILNKEMMVCQDLLGILLRKLSVAKK